jgi:hypothetical protein
VKIIFLLLFALWSVTLIAQPGLTIYGDVGENNVSHGWYVKSAVIGNYHWKKIKIGSGLQFDRKYCWDNEFSGFKATIGREFSIKEFTFTGQAFFIYAPFSELLYQTNWGALVDVKHNHVQLSIGANKRTYAYTQKAIEEYHIPKDSAKIREHLNIMYSFSYFIKPIDNDWNVGLSVTNYDNFVINQETNPMFNLQGLYRVSEPLIVYAEAWLQISGLTNLEINYFGCYFRTGLLWQLD